MMKYFGYIIADRIIYIYIFKNKNSEIQLSGDSNQ